MFFAVVPLAYFLFAVVAGARLFFPVGTGGAVFLLPCQWPRFTHSLASWVCAQTDKNSNCKTKTLVPSHSDTPGEAWSVEGRQACAGCFSD